MENQGEISEIFVVGVGDFKEYYPDAQLPPRICDRTLYTKKEVSRERNADRLVVLYHNGTMIDAKSIHYLADWRRIVREWQGLYALNRMRTRYCKLYIEITDG